MIKYYTRACNFYYNKTSKENVKKKISLPIGGNKSLSFDSIEIITVKNVDEVLKVALTKPLKSVEWVEVDQITDKSKDKELSTH